MNYLTRTHIQFWIHGQQIYVVERTEQNAKQGGKLSDAEPIHFEMGHFLLSFGICI